MTQLDLTPADLAQLARLLSPLDELGNRLNRINFLTLCGLDVFANRLNMDLDPQNFSTQLIRVLHNDGTWIPANEPALLLLLRPVRDLVAGQENKAAFIDRLLKAPTRPDQPLDDTPDAKVEGPPRVFISYARTDGEIFATALRKRLLAAGIPLWQDRVGMEGGRDWWQQITEAIDKVEFMVLIMTPAAMKSDMVRKEWRQARQNGVCVYPVKAGSKQDFDSLIASLPRWIRDAHFYDLGFDLARLDQGPEWSKFLNDLQAKCDVPRVPFMAEDMPADYIPRKLEYEALIAQLLDEKREEPKAITSALKGAGGYGKTTLARAICHDERIQQAFDDGILWVTLGEKVENPIQNIESLIFTLSGKKSDAPTLDAAISRLRELLADRDILIVIDDVWNAGDLKPFLQGGDRCARLITTRIRDTLPPNTEMLDVDAMQTVDAVKLLRYGLPDGEDEALRKLAMGLGEWALLLKLANGVLKKQVSDGKSLSDALHYANKLLEKRGVTAFNFRNTADRNQAVENTIGISLGLLSPEEQARYRELAIFPEDVDIPLHTIEQLWQATGQLDEIDTEEYCRRYFDLSLLLKFDLNARQIRLHDVIRRYLRDTHQADLVTWTKRFLDACRPASGKWADLPLDEPYLWDQLAYHLTRAGQADELVATVKDLVYLAKKTKVRNAFAAEADLGEAEKESTDPTLSLLKRQYGNMAHILNRVESLDDMSITLYLRLQHLPDLADVYHPLHATLKSPRLRVWRDLPDLPDPALIRTLSGHTNSVYSCALSGDGRLALSASWDKTLKLWDTATGQERHTLTGHNKWVQACALNTDGRLALSASDDRTLKLWDTSSGQEIRTLTGLTDGVNACALSADGRLALSASADQTLKLWDTSSGQEIRTLTAHTASVYGCALSTDGHLALSASDDQTLKLWDTSSGQEIRTLTAHTAGVNACALSANGRLALSTSDDGTLKLWNASSKQEIHTLTGYTAGVNACALSADGRLALSTSDDQTLKLWNASSGQEIRTLTAHTAGVNACALNVDGRLALSAFQDGTLKLWDTSSGQEIRTLTGHTSFVSGCALSEDGRLALSASNDKTLRVWNTQSGQAIHTLTRHSMWGRGCALSADGRLALSTSEGTTLKLWDTQSGQAIHTLTGHTSIMQSCALSADGRLALSASADQTLKVWDIASGECLATFYADGPLHGCAWHPDGEHLLACGDRGLYWLRFVR